MTSQVERDYFTIEVRTIEYDSEGTHLYLTVFADAVEYGWYESYEYFQIYTPISQAFFDIDDLYSITVNGTEIAIPIT